MTREPGNRTLLIFLKNENGATAIEYAIIAAGVATAIIASVSGLGTSVKELWESVSNSIG